MGKKGALDVLAENLGALRRVAGNPTSQAEIAKLAGVDQTTVGRVLRRANSLNVAALDGLAAAFRCHAWQLLQPGLDAERAVRLAKLSPRALEVAELFDALPPRRQALLYAHVQDMHNPEAAEADGALAPTESPAMPDASPTPEHRRGAGRRA